MLRSLLVSVAAIALLAGPSIAQTTTTPEQAPVTTSQTPPVTTYPPAAPAPAATPTYSNYTSNTNSYARTAPALYGRIDIGSGVAGDIEFDGSVTGPAGTATLPFDTSSDLDLGWQTGAALGVTNFPLPNWRTEIEGVYVNNETDDDADNFDDVFDTGDEGEDVDSASADVNIYGGFLNLIYDFDTGSRWRPFLGGGVGYGRVEIDYDGLQGEDEVFLYQGKAGVSYQWSDRTAFELGYRYLRAESASFDDSELDLDVTGEVDTQIHSVVAGVRYKFGGT